MVMVGSSVEEGDEIHPGSSLRCLTTTVAVNYSLLSSKALVPKGFIGTHTLWEAEKVTQLFADKT